MGRLGGDAELLYKMLPIFSSSFPMNNIFTKEETKGSSPMAFILYQKQTNKKKDEYHYNDDALNIISFSLNYRKKSEVSSSDITSLCLKWIKLLDNKLNRSDKNGADTIPSTEFIDIFQSHKRRYGVRGVVMLSKSGAKEKQYLFLLERVCNDNVSLQKAFRQWKLTPREREIIQLLIDDRCNKEIARILNLSINTIKGYLKLLMLKLRVTSRAGVVARILTGE